MQKISNLATLATKISALVHETQKERGVTAVFMGSEGDRFSSEVKQQRTLTNQYHQELTLFLTDFDVSNYNEKLKDRLFTAKSSLSKLANIRSSAFSISRPTSEVIA